MDSTVEVLSILIPRNDMYNHAHFFSIAENTLNQELYEFNRMFELEIHTVSRQDEINQQMRMEVMMMAGESYDLFLLTPQHNLWRLSQSGFIEDIYALIDNCRHTSREDFLTNVLNAFTINERLYAFPMRFSFNHLAINSLLPQDLITRFNEKDVISQSELLAMYIDLQNKDIDEFNLLTIADPKALLYADYLLAKALTDFVNPNTRVSNLNSDEFVSFLTRLQQVEEIRGFPAERDFMAFEFSAGWLVTSGRRMRQMRQRMFISDSAALDSFHIFFEHNIQCFLNHKPVSNNDGELHIRLTSGYGFFSPFAFSIAATGNGSLAWDFLRHLIAPVSVSTNYYQPRRDGDLSQIPIKRSYLESNFLAVLYHHSYMIAETFVGMGEEDEERDTRIQQALERLKAFSEMPVATIPLVPISIIEEDLSLFMDGIITAEDAALRMHNRVSLWLIE